MRISDKKEKSHDQFIELLTIRKMEELIFLVLMLRESFSHQTLREI